MFQNVTKKIAGKRLLAMCLFGFVMLSATAHASNAAASEEITLASGGEAHYPVVLSREVSAKVREAGETLAEYLGLISGAEFDVTEGDGGSGIVVGLPENFESLAINPDFEEGPFAREDYFLHSGEEGVWILGATAQGVEHGVWDILHRLGYRQYFPGETWEIIPDNDVLSVNVSAKESPDYYARSMWYGWGTRWNYNSEPYSDWCERNRMVQGFQLRSGHAYDGIIRRNQDVFDKNPEYLALVDDERGGNKFCISNEGLRDLVVEDAIERVEHDTDSISMDPSDGGGWCECEDCAEMGSVSDRVVLLANEVAEAINELGMGDKYVGIYAYHMHSPPPSVQVHPKVIVSAATGFTRGGYSFEEILEGWREKGATLGIYDYFSVMAWDWNLPHQARGGRPYELAERIADFHTEGARFFDAESGDAWGPYGLGFYVSSRLLWDIEEAERVDDIIEEFFHKAFAPVSEPMEEFYRLAVLEEGLRSSEDLLARMYRTLSTAYDAALDYPSVRRRIEDLILYTRYVELYENYQLAEGEEAREEARDWVLEHAYRMRETMMIHSYALWARKIGQEAAHTEGHRLKNDAPFTDEDFEKILKVGKESNQPTVLDFDETTYSEELVPAAEPLDLPDVDTVPSSSYRGAYVMYTWMNAGSEKLSLEVEAGLSRTLPRDIVFKLYYSDAQEPVDQAEVPADGEQYEIHLQSPHEGLHRLEWDDRGVRTHVEWPEYFPMTRRSCPDHARSPHHRWYGYFYVPRGTEIVGGFTTHNYGRMFDSDGTVVFNFGDMDDAGYFQVPVPEGQDGALWKFHGGVGERKMMTVPPYIARNARELLLPVEVVEKDRLQ